MVLTENGMDEARPGLVHMQNFGVLIFFYISGFLFTASVLKKKARGDCVLRDLLADWFARIFTSLIPLLAILFIIDNIIFSGDFESPYTASSYDLSDLVLKALMLAHSPLLSRIGDLGGMPWLLTGAFGTVVARPAKFRIVVPVVRPRGRLRNPGGFVAASYRVRFLRAGDIVAPRRRSVRNRVRLERPARHRPIETSTSYNCVNVQYLLFALFDPPVDNRLAGTHIPWSDRKLPQHSPVCRRLQYRRMAVLFCIRETLPEGSSCAESLAAPPSQIVRLRSTQANPK